MSKRIADVLLFVVVTLVNVILLDRCMADPSHPCWIWGASGQTTNESVRLDRTFQTSTTTSSAVIRFAPMYSELTISLDGHVIAAAEPYDAIQALELATRLGSGDHLIVVEAKSIEGPSAFFLQLDLKFEDGSRQSIVSDETWRVGGASAAKNLGAIDRRLVVPETRRVGIDAVDNYEQWRQAIGTQPGTDPASFLVAPGFEMRLVRSAASDEDSWISMEFDPQGRIVIGKEKVGLLRMTLSGDGNEVTKVETVDDTLEECRGLAFIGDDLYANANNSKGLYRLRRDGDRFAEPELVYSSTGGAGHGRNDLAVGPDGMLYSIHGDSVDLPNQAEREQDVIDYTSPFREARRGKKTSEGHLLRIDPESAAVEVLTSGLRNPFGIDFNADGEIFTYDADAEYDMGSPWYRPTRVSNLVTGGDYGWRGVTKSWPPYFPDHPDNARPNLDIGKGSPTAVKFGDRSNFPQPYRDALYILDWAYGRIIAVHMIPRGSSYLMTAETFLKGRPLNVTDLDFARNGSLYLVTGGRKTQSALYRVRYVGSRLPDEGSPTPTPTPMQVAGERFAKDSRQLRRELESELALPPSESRLAKVWTHLASPDPWIRQAAVNVIERQPIEMWQSRALRESQMTPALQALTALARSGQRELFPAILRRLNELLPDVVSQSEMQTALYVYRLCLEESEEGEIDDQLRAEIRERLNACYPSQSYSENQLLSELLVRLEAHDVVTKTIGLLNAAPNQTAQMHYLYVLRNVRQGWTVAQRRSYFSGLAQAWHFLGGAGMPDFLNKIREEAIATLDDSQRQELGSLLDERPPVEVVVQTQPRSLVQKWTVDELLKTAAGQGDGDAVRGGEVFASASCIQCHRFGTRGTLIGPDLTAASRRFSRRDLLVSIIEPSKVIAENYRGLQIVTSDGRTIVGQPTVGGDYRSSMLSLATDPRQPLETTEIPKTEIESQKFSDVSWMPAGLLDTFSRDEIRDLIAYIESAL